MIRLSEKFLDDNCWPIELIRVIRLFKLCDYPLDCLEFSGDYESMVSTYILNLNNTTFDERGNILSEPNGDLTEYYTYDEYNNELSFISDTYSEYRKYDESNNLVETRTECTSIGESKITTYKDGKKLSISRNDGFKKTFYYNPNGKVRKYATSCGYCMDYHYDENDNLIQQIDSYGDSFEYEYDKNNNRISTKSGYGSSKSTYDENNNELTFKRSCGHEVECTYDKINNKTSRITKGRLYEYWEYDNEK
jgi:hypothetical protein